MKCVICKTGITKMGKTSTMFEREGSLIIIKDIPAEICDQCGEAYFDEETTRELMRIANEAFNNGAELEVIRMKAA
jgi:YgiT-type zinc finger domain-containing protein